jgi:hypothetical protein
VDDTISYLQNNNVRLSTKGEARAVNNGTLGATVGMLWLDIEGTDVSSPSSILEIHLLIHNYL